MAVIYVHLCLSAVNNEIGIIPACFFFCTSALLRWCPRVGTYVLGERRGSGCRQALLWCLVGAWISGGPGVRSVSCVG
jgi:hypothetical protein